jgi:hypothetical protein
LILSAGIEIHFLSICDVLKPNHSFTDILRVGVEIDRAKAESVFKSEWVPKNSSLHFSLKQTVSSVVGAVVRIPPERNQKIHMERA